MDWFPHAAFILVVIFGDVLLRLELGHHRLLLGDDFGIVLVLVGVCAVGTLRGGALVPVVQAWTLFAISVAFLVVVGIFLIFWTTCNG